MGAFNINITGVGGHGCERKAKPGEKLSARCGKFTCPDCAAYDFTQRLRQAGMLRDGEAAHSIELKDGEPVPLGMEERIYNTDHDDHTETARYAVIPHSATFTHWPGQPSTVVDDMLKNERRSGQF